jgi:hypothetical protein
MHDVTESCLQDVTAAMSEKERQATINSNIDKVRKSWTLKLGEETTVRPFFYGNQYILFVTETYRDVRLVGAPPASIGKFGADTDNWVWPRHTGDFALFRVYAAVDNRPADYSTANIPLRPRHSLPISLDGVAEGDFTLVMGFPGRTQQYLPAEAIKYTLEHGDPTRVRMREKALRLIEDEMQRDPSVKLRYIAKQSTIANGWKKWQGEILGLRKSGAVARRLGEETRFTAALQMKNAAAVETLKQLNALYAENTDLLVAREHYSELVNLIELFKAANMLSSADNNFKTGGAEAWNKRIEALKPTLTEFYDEFSAQLDQLVFSSLMDDYFDHYKFVDPELLSKKNRTLAWGAVLYETSILAKPDRMMALLKEPAEQAREALINDPGYKLFSQLRAAYQKQVEPGVSAFQDKTNLLQRSYMQAIVENPGGRTVYPDANGTMRVTYGQVSSYKPRDAVQYSSMTYLDGVIEKYVPGDYEFDLPEKLLKLYERKDFGRYTTSDGRVPVCFIGSNHTSGGNSGSPVVDAYGNLIGLNFDRVWEGTMSDINYDPNICRNVMVDARYVLFIVDKYADAGYLLQEMKLVQPKTPKPTMPAVPQKQDSKGRFKMGDAPKVQNMKHEAVRE